MFRDAQEVAVLGAGLMGTCIAGKATVEHNQRFPAFSCVIDPCEFLS